MAPPSIRCWLPLIACALMVADIGRNAIVPYDLDDWWRGTRAFLASGRPPNRAKPGMVATPVFHPACRDRRRQGDPVPLQGPVYELPNLPKTGPAPEASGNRKPGTGNAPALAVAETQRITNMRVEVSKLDELVNLVGEYDLQRNRWAELNGNTRKGSLPVTDRSGEAIARLSLRR